MVLRSLYRFVSNGTDRVTTFGPNERAIYPLEAQVYYVPDQLDNSRVTLRAEAGPGCVNDYLSESGSVTNRWT